MIAVAATVLVIRDCDVGIEVVLVRRSAKSTFMSDAYVYPGGRIDPDDTISASRIRGDLTSVAQKMGVPTETAAPIVAGAFRETFEECGILVADEPIPEIASSWRKRVHDQDVSFSEFLTGHDLYLPNDIRYFAHWTTPVVEKRRFDTHFFVVRAPAHQALDADGHETVDVEWVSPNVALAHHRNGQYVMFPPTVRTLERLAQFSTVQAVFDAEIDVPHIIPHFVEGSEYPILLLPGDPEFPEHLIYNRAESVTNGPTRLVFMNGFWEHK